MNLDPVPSARPKRRIPMWLKVTLGAFVVLVILAAIFGKPAENPSSQPIAGSAPVGATTASSTTSAVSATSTVVHVVDGATVELADGNGIHRTVHLRGLIVPTGNNCYAAETLAWASSKLVNATVTITSDTATGVALALADGTDYATAALQGGYAKYATEAVSTTLQEAEAFARQQNAGLWGPPCNGTIDAPTPQAPPPPPAPAVSEAHEAAPPAVKTTKPVAGAGKAPEHHTSVTYQNCAEAKAAGAAPLYAGEPGYSRKLDRDGDGVACED